jgi:hypothetical protein
MPKENSKNLLAGPDNEQWVVEAHEGTKNRFFRSGNASGDGWAILLLDTEEKPAH